MNKFAIIAGIVLLFSCNSNKNPHIQITTNYGNIEAELFADKAPGTVAAFLSYVDAGMYKKSSFYRVLLEESMASNNNTGLIQGGIWQSDNKKAVSIPGIAHESPRQTGLSHTSGTLSLARNVAGSANTEFFICIGDHLDFDSSKTANPDGLGFAAFGRVVSGMTIVREIQSQPANGQSFVRPVTILNIERL
ncbi:peptidylprolyl isomerase [Ferruginibacter sp. SUN106]|uniref:peptidylprolyl isomerase n=1 Tax=Ferruginibacter sp. SUN106 TaxID=2978348 RepID=UPI003D3628CA